MDEKSNKRSLPVIRLDDLLPGNDVKGGKIQRHMIFGVQPPLRSEDKKSGRKTDHKKR